MLIHSVTPIHMLTPQDDIPETEMRNLSCGGYMELTRTPQGLMVSRISSTDPASYLKKEYSPGRILS